MPMAYSVAGRPGFVVATRGLSDCLTESERDAVIAHERAHLRGHHHRIINVCEVLAKTLPMIPLCVAAPAAVRRLVELAADERAAYITSPDAVRSALRVVATTPPCRNRCGPSGSATTRSRPDWSGWTIILVFVSRN